MQRKVVTVMDNFKQKLSALLDVKARDAGVVLNQAIKTRASDHRTIRLRVLLPRHLKGGATMLPKPFTPAMPAATSTLRYHI